MCYHFSFLALHDCNWKEGCFLKVYTRNQQIVAITSFLSVNLLEHSHVPSLTYYLQWLLDYSGRVEYLWQRLCVGHKAENIYSLALYRKCLPKIIYRLFIICQIVFLMTVNHREIKFLLVRYSWLCAFIFWSHSLNITNKNHNFKWEVEIVVAWDKNCYFSVLYNYMSYSQFVFL